VFVKKLLFSFILIVGFLFLFAYITSRPEAESQTNIPTNVVTKKQSVCLDAGHGGDDLGASNNEINESDINLSVAKKVESILEKAGYEVFMTRSDDSTTLSNNDRYTFCNLKNASILVSVHHNYFDDSSVNYDTVLYYKDSDKALATSILSSTSARLSVSNNSITQFEDGVLSKSNMPAALSEAFFITNSDEYASLSSSPTRLNEEAEGIATGIMNYFNSTSS
jgi:N-acetylmuramoyl-L-alanine amidase